MKHKDPDISLEDFKKIHHYDPLTGVFTRLKAHAHRSKVGERSDYNDGSYRRISIPGHKIRAHRAAVFYMTGSWPHGVDHVDGDGQNNKWENLRPYDHHSQNMCNWVQPPALSGVRGVKLRGGWYETRVDFQRRIYSAGRFKSLDEATKAVRALREELHGEFAVHD